MKQRNNKPLFILGGLIVLFIVFFWVITIESTFSKFKKDVLKSVSFIQIKSVYTTYSEELSNNPDFLSEISKRLDIINQEQEFTEEQRIEAERWIGNQAVYFNLIIVPDLSRRLGQIPNQEEKDKEMISEIYDMFQESIKRKAALKSGYKSKDRLIIDVTDDKQAGGNFRKIANELIIDLAIQKPPYWKYLDDSKKTFSNNVEELYKLGEQKGADYWNYFEKDFLINTKKSTFSEKYRNVVVILTDGYLESESNCYTCQNNIQPLTKNLSDWEVLILEAGFVHKNKLT
jgi:hypothetical protein